MCVCKFGITNMGKNVFQRFFKMYYVIDMFSIVSLYINRRDLDCKKFDEL